MTPDRVPCPACGEEMDFDLYVCWPCHFKQWKNAPPGVFTGDECMPIPFDYLRARDARVAARRREEKTP